MLLGLLAAQEHRGASGGLALPSPMSCCGPTLHMAMLHRFLITVLPSEGLAEAVIALRNTLYAGIGSFSGRHVPPHITLCFLDLPAACGHAITDAMAGCVANLRSFTLQYDGITHFPDKRTIYIDLVETEAIATVRTPIVAAMKSNDTLREAIRETDHPHLTIAAGLKPAQFERAWESLAPHVSHPAFSGECRSKERVTGLVLLRRKLRPGARYEHLRSFPLG